MRNLAERQKEIAGRLNTGFRQYSARMAEEDLQRLTGGYYHLDGYTGKYVILCGKKPIVTQITSRLGLRGMVITALDLFFSAVDDDSA